MSGYLLGVIGVVLFCAVLSVIIPKGKTSTMVVGVSRLACIVAIVAPIPAYFTGEKENFFGKTSIDVDDDFIKYCSELRIQEAENLLQTRWEEEYEQPLSVTLYWGFEDGKEKIAIYQATVYHQSLSQQAQNEIVEYMQEKCSVQVVFYEQDGEQTGGFLAKTKK